MYDYLKKSENQKNMKPTLASKKADLFDFDVEGAMVVPMTALVTETSTLVVHVYNCLQDRCERGHTCNISVHQNSENKTFISF